MGLKGGRSNSHISKTMGGLLLATEVGKYIYDHIPGLSVNSHLWEVPSCEVGEDG